jgi:small subunit ribosomal protein S3
VISGKLRTERARFEKFRAGAFPRCGEPALRWMHTAEVHVQLKPGIIGVRVKLMPPDAVFPDKIQILTPPPLEEKPEVLKPEVKPETKVEVNEEIVEVQEVAVETMQEKPEEKAQEPAESEGATEEAPQ